MYRVGLPFWKTAARWGVPVLVRVLVHRDAASNTYWADSPDLDGLVVSGKDLDELCAEANAATAELLSLAVVGHKTRAQTELRIRDEALCAA